uniref:Uncharacterized protein n=1 Tax=Sphaerodactylus townsendi TaxID=933632 RepID=A0ACB8EG05_9SAUR
MMATERQLQRRDQLVEKRGSRSDFLEDPWLEDTEAVPDVHSVDVGLPNVSVKMEKENDDPWESNHHGCEENKAFPEAHSEFPEGMTEVKDEEESWNHQAVEENMTIACSEFPY